MPEHHAAVRPLGEGLFTGLLRLVRLDDNSAPGVRRRVLAVALLAWLPLLLLATAQGQLLQGAAVPFVRDIEVHVRLLVVIPLLLVAEVGARNFLPTVVQEFRQRNLLPSGALARYDAAVAAASRLRNSAWAEVALIVLVYAVFMGVVWRQYGSLYASTWYAATTSEGSQLTPAGYWYFFVSLPIVQFLLLRWYLWIFAWARFLWQVSRIRLDLMATHPDRAGGLGFLESSGHIFGMVAVAHGAVAAGPFASMILFRGAALPKVEVTLTAVSGWSLKETTDDQGKVSFRLPWKGTYGLLVRHKDAKPGKRKGADGKDEAFDGESFGTTFTFATSTGLPSLPAPPLAPPNTPMPAKAPATK